MAGRPHSSRSTEPTSHRAAADARNQAIWELASTVGQGAPARILDVGCGTTVPLREFVAARPSPGRAAAVVGIDWSATHLRAAPPAAAGQPAISRVQAGAGALPVADASIDLVSCFTLFSSLPTPAIQRAAAAELLRVLRPGGIIAWYDLRYPSTNPKVHAIGRRRLAALFPGCTLRARSVTLLPPLSRAVVPGHPGRYGALVRLPFLRSHLAALLQKAA